MPAKYLRETPAALDAVPRLLALDYSSPSGLASRQTGKPLGFSDGGYWRLRLAGMPRPGNRFFAHRVVWALHRGAWPAMDLDHINGDGLDNRVENLREATPSENARNLVRITAANRSGFPGVSQHAKGGWQATVRMNGANIYAGHYGTREAAFLAAYEAKGRLHPDAIGFLAAWRPAYDACLARVATLAAFGEVRPSLFGGPEGGA